MFYPIESIKPRLTYKKWATLISNNMKRIKFMTSLVIFYLMSCNYQNYFKAFKVSSPDGQKCLSFIGEYDDNGYIKNNRIYILGYEVDVLKK